MINKEQSHKEQMNHQAYQDVLECKRAQYTDDEDYMSSYQGWYNIAGGEKHFDPHYCESDMEDL